MPTQQQAPAIHVQGLEKWSKQLQVLGGVDFDVAYVFAMVTYRRKIA
jgi:hypothetical protein